MDIPKVLDLPLENRYVRKGTTQDPAMANENRNNPQSREGRTAADREEA